MTLAITRFVWYDHAMDKKTTDDGNLHLTSIYRLFRPRYWVILYIIAMIVNFSWLHNGYATILCQIFIICAIRRFVEDSDKKTTIDK